MLERKVSISRRTGRILYYLRKNKTKPINGSWIVLINLGGKLDVMVAPSKLIPEYYILYFMSVQRSFTNSFCSDYKIQLKILVFSYKIFNNLTPIKRSIIIGNSTTLYLLFLKHTAVTSLVYLHKYLLWSSCLLLLNFTTL